MALLPIAIDASPHDTPQILHQELSRLKRLRRHFHHRLLGKRTFAVCDKQDDGSKALIEAQVEVLLMHEESGFENLVLRGTTEEALKRFAKLIDWPPHLKAKYPDLELQAAVALPEYFAWSKGNWGIADFLAQCSEAEIPKWIREACRKLKVTCTPAPAADGAAPAPVDAGADPGAGGDAAD